MPRRRGRDPAALGGRDDVAVSPSTAHRSLSEELRAATDRVSQLERALTSRIIIDVAVGVLIERHALDRAEAFQLLRRAARHHRRRIHDLAADVVRHRTERPEIAAILALRRQRVPEPTRR